MENQSIPASTQLTTDELFDNRPGYAIAQGNDVSDTITQPESPTDEENGDETDGISVTFTAPVTLDKLNEMVDDDDFADVQKERKTGERKTKQWWPAEGAQLRVHKNGAVYPSKDAMEAFDLEYKEFARKTEGGCMDIFAPADVPTFQPKNKVFTGFVFVAVAPKGTARMELFNHTKYVNDNDVNAEIELAKEERRDAQSLVIGTPKASAYDQGTPNETIAESIKKAFGDNVFDATGYVDIVMAENATGNASVTKWTVLREVTRGKDKGKGTAIEYNANDVKLYKATLLS